MQHQYPLHRISYCADDKNDKRIFTFIAKEADSNQHRCFVFDSDKCVCNSFLHLFIDIKSELQLKKTTIILSKYMEISYLI